MTPLWLFGIWHLREGGGGCMCVRVRVPCKCSRKGRGAMIQVLVCISALRQFSGPIQQSLQWGEDGREILEFGPKAEGEGG